MKESVTKFDLESAFKALDEIDVPVSAKGIKANKPALTEIFSRKSKFDALFEEYYDIGSTEELGEAKEEREAEIAKAKLARIEKIVDLDADSPEDLLTSYVGKYIIQCPQCMTLFYKDKEDVVESEEDPTNVNVGEQCQHCGNESGYTLIGKVGEADQEEAAEVTDETAVEESPAEETPEEDTAEETTEETTDLDINLDDLDLEEPAEEEKKEESFVAHTGEALVEEITDDKELDAKLEAHSEYIEYLRNTIAEEEAALEKTDNEQVKAAIQRRIDAFKADLEAALPEEVKNSTQEESVEEPTIEEEPVEEAPVEEVAEETVEESLVSEGTALTEALQEDVDLEVSADEFKQLIDSSEFKKPISDIAVRAMLNAGKDEEKKVEEDVELTEAGLGDFFKGIGSMFQGLPAKRADRADWILKMSRKDFNKIELDAKGNVIKDDPDNQKFKAYAIYYFTNKDKNGKEIEKMPEQNEYEKLVPAKEPAFTQEYKKAENAAIGWSKTMGNGPALIFLTEKKADQNKVFLCGYFGGKLVNDKLEDYCKAVKASIDGMKKQAKSAGSTNASELNFKDMKATDIRTGMQVKIGDDAGTVTEVKDSRDKKNFIFTVKFSDGDTEPHTVAKTGKVKAALTIESLESVMGNLEELNESVLEQLISDSLVEAYGNIAGYKLTDCEYLNEKFNVNGTIYFTSGKTRKTTYAFSEAFVADNKVNLIGLNEKLGVEKQFVLTGNIQDKTLITESFRRNK